jgi:preprotein translocase subunit YajC
MNQFMLSLLMGAPAGGSGDSRSTLLSFAPIVAIIAIFYFLIIRPQSKKQKETQRMLEALKKGDRIVTIGGIHGIIQSVHESSIILRVDENTKIEFSRSAIATVNAPGKAKSEKEEKPEIEEKSDDDSSK